MRKKKYLVNYACIPCGNAILIVCGKCGEKLSWGEYTSTGGSNRILLKCEKHGAINAPYCDCGKRMFPFDGTSEDF